MTYLEAAEAMLSQAATPLRVEETAKRAIAEDWLETNSKTPHATMTTCLAARVQTLSAVDPCLALALAQDVDDRAGRRASVRIQRSLPHRG